MSLELFRRNFQKRRHEAFSIYMNIHSRSSYVGHTRINEIIIISIFMTSSKTTLGLNNKEVDSTFAHV